MTTEITGLGTAQQFAAGMAAAHAGAIAPTDAFRASVTAAGVTGDAVSAADRAAAAQADAAAAWRRAHAALLEQDRVAEAYAANPDAGSREFLTDAGDVPVGVPSSRPSSLPEDHMTQPPLPDPLRLAGRFQLAPGEQFAGSGSLRDSEGYLLLAAAVDTPDGRQIHVGVPIDPEEKKKWRGGHAPAQETELDEDDGEEYSVDTGADTTVILDAADAARLGEAVDDVVARAAVVDKEYRQVVKDCDRLSEERSRLEAKRFGADGEKKISLDQQVKQEQRQQQKRRAIMDAAAALLPPEDRARYDALQAQIDAGGRDVWEPGQDEHAAAACGLSVAEFREFTELSKLPWRTRTREQEKRYKELDPYQNVPPLLEQQQAIIRGLTLDELAELNALDRSQTRRRRPAEQARYEELLYSPRGATAGTPKKTRKLRSTYDGVQPAYFSVKLEYANHREELAELETTAQPINERDAARLAQVTADLDAANTRWEELAGGVTASAEILGRDGDALVVEAVQREEEGGVDYRLDYKPADADDDWSAGSNGDPYATTAGGLRKIAALLGKLAG